MDDPEEVHVHVACRLKVIVEIDVWIRYMLNVFLLTESAPFFTAPEPETLVYFANYVVKNNIGVRARVCAIGRSLRVGGFVQRTSANTVRIRVATPDLLSMLRFVEQVQSVCNPGSVERAPIVESRDEAHINLSQQSFRLIRSSFQHCSANAGDDISSVSGSCSSRELHGFMPEVAQAAASLS